MTNVTTPSERDLLIMKWQEAARLLDEAKKAEMELRLKVAATCFPTAEVGTNNLDLGKGYKLKLVRKLSYSLKNNEGQTEEVVEAIAKMGNEGAFIAERLVKWNPELSVSEYKALLSDDPTHQKIKQTLDTVLTIRDATPSLEVVVPKSNR